MAAAGEPVRAYKPVLSGLDEQAGASQHGAWPADHELLGAVAGMAPEEVAPLRFGPAVSPHLAAELSGRPIDPRALVATARRRATEGTLVVEGVGGLLVPLRGSYTVLDLASELELALVIAARPGLGTINHTLLTLHAARSRELDVRAVVLTPWPEAPGPIETSNRETIARLGGVDVHTLAPISEPLPAQLASAGCSLPWREWLQAPAR
jgi:dethiobiotin synthetase